MEDEINKGLREMDVPGFIRFSIKTENTEANIAIHDEFKDFCRCESDNNYTIGLKMLMNNWKEDVKTALLMDKIEYLESQIDFLKDLVENKKEEVESEDNGTF